MNAIGHVLARAAVLLLLLAAAAHCAAAAPSQQEQPGSSSSSSRMVLVYSIQRHGARNVLPNLVFLGMYFFITSYGGDGWGGGGFFGACACACTTTDGARSEARGALKAAAVSVACICWPRSL